MSQALEDRAADLRARLPHRTIGFVYILTAITAIDWGSRSTLAVAFEDIKADFGLRDWDYGALVAAFTIVASLSVIPCGVLADRWKRVRLIALGFIPWGVGMLWQGAASSFTMLFIARMFLGTIEATNGPASESLVSDYYSVERRARVMGVWRLGILIGTSIGGVIAGVLVDSYGWRSSFVVFGVLGFMCAGLVLRFLPDPERGIPDALHQAELQLAAHHAGEPAPVADEIEPDLVMMPLRDVFRRLVRIRTAWVMVLAASIGEFVFSGIAAWAVSFFRRYHDMDAAEASVIQFFILIGVIAGSILGGRLADRYVAEDRHERRVVLGALCFGLAWVFSIPAFATDSTPLAIVFLAITGFLIYVPVPGLWAMWFDIIPAPLRGRASSLFTIVRVGFAALAPALISVVSTATSLRTAFLVFMPAQLINGLVLLLARSSYRRDAANARSATNAHVALEAS